MNFCFNAKRRTLRDKIPCRHVGVLWNREGLLVSSRPYWVPNYPDISDRPAVRLEHFRAWGRAS